MTSAAPTPTALPLLAGCPRTTHPPIPSPTTHTALTIHLHPHNSLHPLPLRASRHTPPPSTPAQVSLHGHASGMGWCSSFFVFNIM